MICVFAQSNFSGFCAARRYLQLYPNQRQPHHKLFINIYNNLSTIIQTKQDVFTLKVAIVAFYFVFQKTKISVTYSSGKCGNRDKAIVCLDNFKERQSSSYHLTPIQNLFISKFPLRLLDKVFLIGKTIICENPKIHVV